MLFNTLLLFGAPGAGKGTQGEILGNIPGFLHVACGEVFRDLRVGSPLGRIFLEYSSRGALAPDEFTVELWHEHIQGLIRLHRFDPETDVLILDGIPRNVAQARLMQQYINVFRLYYLDCEDRDLVFMRLKRRALHENRLDDASDTVIQQRLYVYAAETAPVLGFYPEDKILRVDTGRPPVHVLADIIADIRSVVPAEAALPDGVSERDIDVEA